MLSEYVDAAVVVFEEQDVDYGIEDVLEVVSDVLCEEDIEEDIEEDKALLEKEGRVREGEGRAREAARAGQGRVREAAGEGEGRAGEGARELEMTEKGKVEKKKGTLEKKVDKLERDNLDLERDNLDLKERLDQAIRFRLGGERVLSRAERAADALKLEEESNQDYRRRVVC